MIWIIGLSVVALFAAPFLAVLTRRRKPCRTFIYSLEKRRWIPAEDHRLEK